ncbi:hypothetical protein Syun_023834 [Stephania yunnanensis]|uniref:glutathione transferase n=1 Tax=Stephania yunnanensis TaxID=152371 RepID=A0AAP0FI81_9MAGN
MAVSDDLEVKLIGKWSSPFAVRPRIALNLKSIEYEYLNENYLIAKSDLLLKSNPVYKKVPVLLHRGRPICESLVILQYIDEQWRHGPSILPSNPYDRAIARFWAAYIDDKLAPAMLEMKAEREEAKAEAMEKVKAEMEVMEKVFKDLSRGGGFFGGEEVGLVDIVLGSFLAAVRVFESVQGEKVIDEEKTPGLVGWAQRFCAHVAVRDVLPETHKLLEYAKKVFFTKPLVDKNKLLIDDIFKEFRTPGLGGSLGGYSGGSELGGGYGGFGGSGLGAYRATMLVQQQVKVLAAAPFSASQLAFSDTLDDDKNWSSQDWLLLSIAGKNMETYHQVLAAAAPFSASQLAFSAHLRGTHGCQVFGARSSVTSFLSQFCLAAGASYMVDVHGRKEKKEKAKRDKRQGVRGGGNREANLWRGKCDQEYDEGKTQRDRGMGGRKGNSRKKQRGVERIRGKQRRLVAVGVGKKRRDLEFLGEEGRRRRLAAAAPAPQTIFGSCGGD